MTAVVPEVSLDQIRLKNVIQENGQRKYTNPKMAGQKPEKGTEIFIGKLPRDLFEDELVPVLEQYGP